MRDTELKMRGALVHDESDGGHRKPGAFARLKADAAGWLGRRDPDVCACRPPARAAGFASAVRRPGMHLGPALTVALLASACAPGGENGAGGEDPSTPEMRSAEPAGEADHFVPSTPENVAWGWFPIDKEPVLRVRPGETVRINTLTHAGATQSEEPVAYLTGLGLPRDEIPQDVIDFWESREGRPREGRSGHVITGPVHVEGAEPGDVLEVEILSIETRVSWGINNTSARGGVFSLDYPGARPGDPALDIPPGTRHVIRTGDADGREVALISDDIQVPLAPFMGILAVAPDPVVGQPGVTVPGVQGSRPPGAFGGNLDVKDLKAGATVYLPVFHEGALFYAGDPHGAQGDGEVSGTAIEQSLSGVFRFAVRKDRSISAPRAEDDEYYMIMGIDLDLDRAARHATWEVVNFLGEEKGLSAAQALSVASIAVDFRISEVVDLTQVVTGYIPKNIFLR